MREAQGPIHREGAYRHTGNARSAGKYQNMGLQAKGLYAGILGERGDRL